ncbi:MAG: hypothetical protein ACK5CY_05910 [Bacteroidia bacterium]
MQTQLKQELYDVISGKSQVRFGTIIQSVTSYLTEGSKPSSEIENPKHFKKEEAKKLVSYVTENDLWINDIDFTQYISEGAEQKVYLKNSDHVLKLNDSIYYNSWRDYFLNLLLHNFFFADTAYELLGFTYDNEILYAVVQQAYVSITSNTDLSQLNEFLTSNGFQNTRNNDYFNPSLGIILEDLHDENVLTRNGVLYFIDTVFYLTEEFNNSP